MLSRDAELEALAVLCRELAALGLSLGLSDARPAVVIRMKGMSPLWVTVDASGGFFEWSDPVERHVAEDPAGAAVQLREHINAHRPGPGDPS